MKDVRLSFEVQTCHTEDLDLNRSTFKGSIEGWRQRTGFMVDAKSGSTTGGIPLGSWGCGTQNIKIASLRICQYLPATKGH